MVKNTSTVLLAFLFTMLIGFSGCYQDKEMFVPYEEPEIVVQGDIEDFYASKPDYSVNISLNADDHFIFATENETLIEIQANSFQLASDATAFSGTIELKFTELLNPALFAFEGLPTVSGKQLLKTEGVFRIEARTEDGKELKMKEGKGIKIRLPNEAPSNDALLFAAEGSGEDFNWVQFENEPNTTAGNIQPAEWQVQLDSGIVDFVGGYGYEFNCPLWNWINVDIFIDIPEEDKTTVCVELAEKYTNKNTVVFMLFHEIESILALHGDADKMLFCEPYGATPIGYKVYFIVISNQGDDLFHFALQSSEIKKDHIEFIEPEEKTLEEIIKIIEEL